MGSSNRGCGGEAHRKAQIYSYRNRGCGAKRTAKVHASASPFHSISSVIAATESTDGYTGTTPVQIAELMGLPSITFAKSIEIAAAQGELTILYQTESTTIYAWPADTQGADDE